MRIGRLMVACLLVSGFLLTACARDVEPASSEAPAETQQPERPVPDVVGLPADKAFTIVRASVGPGTTIRTYSATKHGGISIDEPDPSRPATSTVTSLAPSPGEYASESKRMEGVALFLGDGSAAATAPKGAGPGWFYHPTTIQKQGAEPCFECHQETFCSDCHTKLDERETTDDDGSVYGTTRLNEVGVQVLGRGSETELGVREVLYRNDKDGPTYTVAITAPQFGSQQQAEAYFKRLATALIAAMSRDSRLAGVDRLEFAWFQTGADLPALREVYRRRPGTEGFRRAVPYYEPNVSRFVD